MTHLPTFSHSGFHGDLDAVPGTVSPKKFTHQQCPTTTNSDFFNFYVTIGKRKKSAETGLKYHFEESIEKKSNKNQV